MFAFGDAPFYGSIPGGQYAATDVVGLAARRDGGGYWMASAQPVGSARFQFSARPIDAALAVRMQPSWRPGCPVGLESLRYLTMRHWGYDGKAHTGELVVNADAVGAIQSVMTKLWNARFPIERMELVDNFVADDDASMAANNTSAFNCRFVEGTTRLVGALVRTRDRHQHGAEPLRRCPSRLAAERRGLRQPSHRCAGHDPRRRRRRERVRARWAGAGVATSTGPRTTSTSPRPAGRSEPITPEWCLTPEPSGGRRCEHES